MKKKTLQTIIYEMDEFCKKKPTLELESINRIEFNLTHFFR